MRRPWLRRPLRRYCIYHCVTIVTWYCSVHTTYHMALGRYCIYHTACLILLLPAKDRHAHALPCLPREHQVAKVQSKFYGARCSSTIFDNALWQFCCARENADRLRWRYRLQVLTVVSVDSNKTFFCRYHQHDLLGVSVETNKGGLLALRLCWCFCCSPGNNFIERAAAMIISWSITKKQALLNEPIFIYKRRLAYQ